MKKVLVTTAAMLLTVGAFAQGTVTFGNATSTSGITPGNRQVTWAPTAAQFNAALTAGANVSSNYAGLDLTGLRVALVYAPSTVTDLSQFQFAAFTGGFPTFKGSTSATAGSWFTKTATLNGITAGQTANLAAIVWDSRLAASPFDAAAKAGLFGQSAIFTYTVPAGSTPAPSEFVSQNLTAFTVGMTIIPEPTSFALLGLGAAGLLIFRRRN